MVETDFLDSTCGYAIDRHDSQGKGNAPRSVEAADIFTPGPGVPGSINRLKDCRCSVASRLVGADLGHPYLRCHAHLYATACCARETRRD